MSRIVLLNSGGMDSLACMLLMKERNFIHSLYLDLGYHNRKQAAKISEKLARFHCNKHTYFRVFPDEFVLHINKKGWECPPFFGQLIMVIGAAWARAHEYDYVASGIRKDVWNEAADGMLLELLKYSDVAEPVIPLRPLKSMNYTDVLEIVKDEPLLKATVSCRSWPPCGMCRKCLRRAKLGID